MEKEHYNLRMGVDEPERIDITSGWEVSYWSFKLECTVDELLVAEDNVGDKIKDIRASINLMKKKQKR
ncbi:MAG: DUF3606 domain-containing protein [Cyclobacteriaceae bacterium]|nr:DUF3606 domain-containing protein [Cyclobacteriaceae bacterium]